MRVLQSFGEHSHRLPRDHVSDRSAAEPDIRHGLGNDSLAESLREAPDSMGIAVRLTGLLLTPAAK